MTRTRSSFFLMLLLPLLALAGSLLLAVPAFSFLPQLTSSQPDRWSLTAFPIQWNLNPSTSGAKISGSQSVAQVMQTSFDTWTVAPNTAVSLSRGSDSSVSQEKNSPSNINLICFVCSDAPFGGTETLAVTVTTTANGPGASDGHGGTTQFAGQIIKGDISFNPSTQFDTGGGTGQDMQAVATHEIGHFLGLDHSAVVQAVMFPFAPGVLTTLSYDDVAGISSLYPRGTPDVVTGSISGKVTLNGSSVFGAHVFANSTTSALAFSNIRKTPIGTLTLPDGTYTISGIPPDSYLVAAEPLDLPVSDSDVSWASEFNQAKVQTNFTTRWH
jgi:Matrixin